MESATAYPAGKAGSSGKLLPVRMADAVTLATELERQSAEIAGVTLARVTRAASASGDAVSGAVAVLPIDAGGGVWGFAELSSAHDPFPRAARAEAMRLLKIAGPAIECAERCVALEDDRRVLI